MIRRPVAYPSDMPPNSWLPFAETICTQPTSAFPLSDTQDQHLSETSATLSCFRAPRLAPMTAYPACSKEREIQLVPSHTEHRQRKTDDALLCLPDACAMASRTSFPGQFESFQAKSSAIAAASFTEIRNQSVLEVAAASESRSVAQICEAFLQAGLVAYEKEGARYISRFLALRDAPPRDRSRERS